MKRLSQQINKFDYFNIPLQLHFNKQEKFTIWTGLLFSVLINGILIALLVTSGIEIVNKTSPIVNISKMVVAETPNVTMNTKNLFLRLIYKILIFNIWMTLLYSISRQSGKFKKASRRFLFEISRLKEPTVRILCTCLMKQV